MTASLSEDSTPGAEISLLSWAPLAAIAGPLWATLGLLQGVTAKHFVALAGGGALSVWLALVALSELQRNRALLRAVLAASAAVSLLLTVLGEALWRSTHHRPLGAVTFAVLACATLLFSLLVFSRRSLPLAVSAVASGVALVAVSYFSGRSTPFALLEGALGVLLCGLAFSFGRRALPKTATLRAFAGVLIMLAAVIAVGLSPESSPHALILGIPGLLN